MTQKTPASDTPPTNSPPAPSHFQYTNDQRNQLTLDADQTSEFRFPDFSWLEEETKETRRQQWSRRLGIFIIHLNIFLIIFLVYIWLHWYTKGAYPVSDPVRLNSVSFSWICEMYRLGAICMFSWLVFMVTYWAVMLIFGILKISLERRLGQTTMGDILLKEANRLEWFIHYTLISVAAYCTTNTIITIIDNSLSDPTTTTSTERFSMKEIVLNIKSHLFAFEYPATIINALAYNAFFSTLLLVERIFIRKFAINFHFNYFQDRVQINTFVLGTLDQLREQLKKLQRENVQKTAKRSARSLFSSFRSQISHKDTSSSAATAATARRQTPAFSSETQAGNPHQRLANAIFSVLMSFRDKNNLIEDDFHGLLTQENASKFFSNLVSFSAGTEEISRQQFVEFVEGAYQEKEDLLRSINDQEDLIRQLNRWLVLFILIVTLMFCLPKIFLLIFPVAYALDNVVREDLEDAIDAGIFVFIKHPFDVGDSILLSNTKYKIISIDFMITTMIGPSGDIVYLRNCMLNRMVIHNIKRAGFCFEDFCFSVDPSVEMDTLELLRTKVVAFIEKHPQDYKGYFKMWGYDLINSHRLDIYMTIEFACNRHIGPIYNEKKSSFLLEIKRLLTQLDIPIAVNQYN